MNNDTVTLLPCPFGGNNVRVWCATGSDGKEWYVESSACRIGSYYSKAAAIAAWNTRTEARPASTVLSDVVAARRVLSEAYPADAYGDYTFSSDQWDAFHIGHHVALSQGRDGLVEAECERLRAVICAIIEAVENEDGDAMTDAMTDARAEVILSAMRRAALGEAQP